METKICNICGEEKPLTEFNFRDRRKGTYRAQCKDCLHKIKNAAYKNKYKERYKLRLKENKKKHRELIRCKIKELKSCGCVICGELDECCLDFHHLYNKDYTISSNPDVTMDTLLNEVEKCIVLCANCHRKLHAGKIALPEQVRFGGGATNTIKQNNRIMQVKVKKLSEKAVLPQKAHKSDAGFDLVVSRITTELNEVGELIIVYHTDLCVEIPDGYFGALFSRSSISRKPLSQTNAVGVIDSGYRGEVVAKFRCTVPAVVPSVYKEGERFAQLIILPIPEVEMIESDTLGDSDRGNNGLGSTGDKAFTDNINESADTPLQQQDSVIDAKDDVTSAEAVTSDQAAELKDDSEEA